MLNIVLAAINAKWIHPSLALRLLKANLGSLEEYCEILEFALRQPLNEKVDPILAARPRILGLSVSIWNHKATLELLAALEEKWRDGHAVSRGFSRADEQAPRKPIVVLGGPEVSWLPEDAEIFRYADYVVRGEGEESFRSLCFKILTRDDGAQLPPREVTFPGGTVTFINHGETAVDVRGIAAAYQLYTDEDLARKLTYVESSRGCPFSCEFCQGPAGRTGAEKVREFPLEPFLADMGKLIDRGARLFKFLDRTFNLDIDRAVRIMEFFLARIENQARPLCVHFEMVPFRFPGDMREILRRFPPGTLRLELGIQTLNPETAALLHIHRPGGGGSAAAGIASRAACDCAAHTVPCAACDCAAHTGASGGLPPELEVLDFLRRETSAIVHADLIAGLPGESFDSFGAGFDKLWRVMSGGSGNAAGGLTPGAGGLSGARDGTAAGGTFGNESRFEIQLGILKCLPGTPITRHNETRGMRYSPEPPYEVIETDALPPGELARIKNFARFWEIIVNRNPFPDLLPRLLPPGEGAFRTFMSISDSLLGHFGRNWGIDRKELRDFLILVPQR